jgi:hypothetical protein
MSERKAATRRQDKMAAVVAGAEAGVPDDRPSSAGARRETRRASLARPEADDARVVQALREDEAEKAAAAKKAREEAAEKEKKGANPMSSFRAIRNAASPANLLNGTTTTRSA